GRSVRLSRRSPHRCSRHPPGPAYPGNCVNALRTARRTERGVRSPGRFLGGCRNLRPEAFVMAPSRVPSNSIDHVGSLKRPPELIAAWRAWEAGKLAPARLREEQDRAIRDAIKMQEDLGLPIVTDGEFRRGGWS